MVSIRKINAPRQLRQPCVASPGNVTKVPYVEHVPPDVTACIFWLKNRDPEHWRDSQQMEHVVG